MDKEEKEALIKENMQIIYQQIKSDMEARESKDQITSITHYEELELFKNESGGVSKQDAYLVRVLTEQEKNMYSIYDENQMQIATVDENGTIKFTDAALEKYEETLTKSNLEKEMLKRIKDADGKAKFKEPEEQQETDINMTQPELEAENQKQQKNQEEEEKEKEKDEQPPQNKEEEIQKIAKKTGMDPKDLTNCSSIKPEQKITDQDTFEDIVNVKGKYTNVYVINANKATDKNKRFAFVGITPEGEAEYIDELETSGAMQTNVNIYSINRDGSRVEEKQTREMFTTKSNPDKRFTVTTGQYGILEVDYVRKDPNENKFIGSMVETEYERPTTTQVRQFMNERRNNKYEIEDAIERTEEQIGGTYSEKDGELESGRTRLENIDKDENNDKAMDIDEEITLHSGETTTLRKEAEKYDMTIEQYCDRFELAEGDCPSEKIETVREEGPDTDDDEPGGRGGRPTPEEEALDRLLNRH